MSMKPVVYGGCGCAAMRMCASGCSSRRPAATSVPRACGLARCRRRAARGGDHGGALLLGGGRVVVVEEQRCQGSPHVPLDVVGQHAEQHVRSHPVGPPVVERPDLQVHRLEAPKRPLDLRQVLVDPHGLCAASNCSGSTLERTISGARCAGTTSGTRAPRVSSTTVSIQTEALPGAGLD